MIFNTHQLTAPIAEYIESIFHFKGFMPQHSIERVVPTGHVFLIFELDGKERNTFDPLTLEPNATYRNAWISGVHKKHLSISAHEGSEMLVVQFKPHGAHPFLHIPIHEFNDRVVQADEILGSEIVDVRDELLTKEESNAKFEIIEAWLLERFQQSNIPDESMINFMQGLIESPVNRYDALVVAYPKSQKSLISQFKKYCGLTPKAFQRIFRFNDILMKINTEQKIGWTEIAYQFGYTDQSHFIKEFKEFSGFNPQEFIVSQHHQRPPNFFPLDDEG